MNPESFRYPLLLGDPRQLEHKLAGSSGLLREYWEDFQHTFLRDPKIRPQVIYLPACLTGEGLDEARQLLRDFWRRLPQLDTDDALQYHTWCYCGTTTRHTVFFDWLAHRDAWSPAEIEEAAECFLTFAFKHPFMVLNARTRASNNQALSMALHCAVVGFLFGHKLCDHPTGKFLFDYGLGRIPDLIGLFPGDGYGGEGSTYTSHVNTPLACWTNDFLRQVAGHDFLDTPFRPNNTTLRRMIEIELRLVSPGGLLAPWDHYGWQRATNSSPFAYLAGITGNPRYLSLIPSVTDWSNPGYLAWGEDDPLWTLAWWPESGKDYNDRELPAELFGWFLPKTGAALDDPKHRARLMQVWDACADGIAGIGRAQCNPNHLMFDYAGEPVFQDGIQDGAQDPWQFSPAQVLATLDAEERERYLAYAYSSGAGTGTLSKLMVGLSPGLIGAANAIVIDEEPWYWPGSSRVGQPELYSNRNGLQIVRADCASFYQPRYDIELARRTSLWSDEGFGVVLDDLRARSSHTWRWQAYLRPEVARDGNSARVNLPNGKTVLLAWEPVEQVRVEPVAGFPRTEEKRSCRLDLLQRGHAARFAVVIAPEAEFASIRRIGDDEVEVVVDGKLRVLRMPAATPISVAPDVHELSDIETDRDIQSLELERLLRWSAKPGTPGTSRLQQIDACLATEAGVASLLAALRSPHWPVQIAAAEALGRRGCREAIPALRRELEIECARPKAELYPTDNNATAEKSLEQLAKRWRLKTALIVALGRLRDREVVPLLGRILAEARDFYPVYSVAAQAIGRIGGPHARAALEPALKESEHNTRIRAQAAQQALMTAR